MRKGTFSTLYTQKKLPLKMLNPRHKKEPAKIDGVITFEASMGSAKWAIKTF
ncbi:hypothetical protein P9597_09540 [Aneurinibacillus migulanus]|uniref:hypothetical protein n=1 Tax=Aneurinibacillus migulanus TaxID=47500 RepID=UPI002E2006DA|nr:hypothetical protein [Aneurinibacillus migulanus]